MKIEFSSQGREVLLFLTTNMAAVTSRANQQYKLGYNDYFIYFVLILFTGAFCVMFIHYS